MRLRVVDIETTGSNPSEIIEIAAVDVTHTAADGWVAGVPRSTMFRPLGPISPHATAVHHLTAADFDATLEPCSPVALRRFLWADGATDAFVAHNAAFERSHIPAAATGGLEWICTLKCARALWPLAPGYSNQGLRAWRGLSLDAERATPAHRAAPDAWVTAHLLIDLLQRTNPLTLLAHSRRPTMSARRAA